jgi:hypothetical protein
MVCADSASCASNTGSYTVPDWGPLCDQRLRQLCERSGIAENFDVLTGEGLGDRAYTRTASCYLTLALEFEERRAHERPQNGGKSIERGALVFTLPRLRNHRAP